MIINKATIDLVKEFEGFEPKAYYCPAGVLTIGYGYTNKAGYGPGVKEGDTWTKTKAEAMLIEGLERFADKLRPMLTREATPNQFGAMVSLAYNIGLGAFSRSTCLKRFNAGDIDGAAEAMTWFNKAGGKVMRGLVRRREAEVALFLDGSSDEAIAAVDEPRDSPMQSTTMQASAFQIASALGTGGAAIGTLDGTSQVVALVFAGVIALSALWIMRERLKKWADGVR